ncbi:MAG TPA: ADP-ribosylation factor-like protein [Polyangiaceae bacterium]|nr:ADP-ribosylation factor-like protein [Polyangiaceae bacterium]
MPIIDKERGVLVVRVVYDGPPLSGKTTTLRALARGLGVSIVSPEEQDGRTLFFDWVDYVGGLFEGRQIRCQIVSVPGQKELAKRRRLLLESADAVVMVGDTRESAIEATYTLLKDLLAWCRTEDPPVGVVIQANKRDAPDSVPRTRIHEEFERIAPLAIVDTVATTGEGVREAFVFAVRLALDRVRALAAQRRLQEGGPSADSAAELLEQLAPLSVRPLGSAVVTPLSPLPRLAPVEAPELEHLAPLRPPPVTVPALENGNERVFTPDPLMPGGFIWPPVDGRMLLHEVSRLERTPVRTPSGDWWASGEGWRFHSAASSLFPSADRGRHELIEWARLHAANLPRLSAGRTVILADAGGGRFRLWQLVRVSTALRERLVHSLDDASSEAFARELLAAALHLLRARDAFHGSDTCLPCTLWTVSGDLQRPPTFVGLMPKPGAERVPEAAGSSLIEREFRPLFHHLAGERADYQDIVAALSREETRAGRDVRAELLRLAAAETLRG